MAVVGSLPCRGRVEGAGGARGRGKRARRGQRATANTAPGDYVACRRGTVSSYPRRPPCSYWPTSLPRIHRAPSLFLFLSLSPLLSSPLLSSHPGPASPSRFFEPPRFPRFFPSSSSSSSSLPSSPSLAPKLFLSAFFPLFRSPWLRFVAAGLPSPPPPPLWPLPLSEAG